MVYDNSLVAVRNDCLNITDVCPIVVQNGHLCWPNRVNEPDNNNTIVIIPLLDRGKDWMLGMDSVESKAQRMDASIVQVVCQWHTWFSWNVP